MTHPTDCKRAIAPRWRTRVHTSALRPSGHSCAVAGTFASRAFALRMGDDGGGSEQMRWPAFPTGGDP
jgi:hypothetical protein